MLILSSQSFQVLMPIPKPAQTNYLPPSAEALLAAPHTSARRQEREDPTKSVWLETCDPDGAQLMQVFNNIDNRRTQVFVTEQRKPAAGYW